MADQSKNGGPNYVREWRFHRGLTLAQLAELVDTNANMIGYLESGERGLTAKWLRKLALALDTTPGSLLEHAPNDLKIPNVDLTAFLSKADHRQMQQLGDIAKALMRDDQDD